MRVMFPGQGAWSLVVLQSTMRYQGALMGLCTQGGMIICVCYVARSGSLELDCFTKYHEVRGGSDGTLCTRRSAQLRVRLPGQGAWSLVVLQDTMRYQGALMGLCTKGGKIICVCDVARSGSLELDCFTKYHEVPGALMGLCTDGGVLNCW